jgi:hypothetical protein
MSDNTPTDRDLIEMIKYINQKCSDLSIENNNHILRILINNIDDDKIQTKGLGTQIKYSDIPPKIIQIIYKYIQDKFVDKLEILNNFTGENSKPIY